MIIFTELEYKGFHNVQLSEIVKADSHIHHNLFTKIKNILTLQKYKLI